ncbi:MAG: GDSL family lipase [Clostridia bacterium]|nr:GDSL family lipase [Clostridia bacterium]
MNRFFKDGATVLFQGDSVTDCDRNRELTATYPENMGEGYAKRFKDLYDTLFPDNKVNFINRGISGNRVRDLLDRYDDDFKAVNPDFISIMIGINDTWRGYDSDEFCSPERFEQEYELLLSKLKADFPDAKILIIEQFALTAHPERHWSEDLDPKRAVTKRMAEKYADYFIPMYDILNNAADKEFSLYELSQDGVHPAPTGHSYIAAEIFKVLGIM